MLWLYINFPSLQLDCLQAEQCSAKSAEVKKHNVKNQQAIVIVDSKKNRIVQLNETAKAKGIELAMGLAMAASLSHELCVVPYQREEQETYLLSIAEQLYSVTANIALFPPQGLALQVGDMLRLYQQLDIYIAAIKAVLKPFNVQTVIACGYSPMSAQALACAGINLLTTKASVITEKMTQLTIAQLFINDKTKHVLARLGINTFAQLQAIPIKDLAKRLDSETIGYLAQLTGKHPDKSLVFYQPKHIFDHSVELLYEMTHVDVLLQPIQQLLQLLEAFLIRRDYICQQLTLYLYQRLDGLSHVLQQSFIVSSASGEYLAKQWLNLVTLKLTNIHLQAPITKVSLFVADMQANTGEVDDLFLGKRGQLSLAQLASLLTNKLGQNKVLRLQQGNDHRVELASAYHPFIEAKAVTARHEKDKNSKNLQTSGERGTANINHAFTKETDKPVPLRPSFILDKPELLQTHVSILHGPERITTAWWEQTTTLNTRAVTSYHQETVDQAYQRDYFVATTKQGQCCWVYKALDKRWYVHGYFS